jgi:hypothetical protein
MASVLEFRLTGGASNSDPDASLGGVMSSNELSGTALNNLFDNVDPDEASAGDTEYRAIDIYNSGDATATSVEMYMSTETSSSDTQLDMGHDATNDPHISSWDGETIANESTAPASPAISFAHRTTGSRLSLPNIPASQACRVFVKRVVSASAGNTSEDLGTIRVDYA